MSVLIYMMINKIYNILNVGNSFNSRWIIEITKGKLTIEWYNNK